jgi:hypothetical protein
VNRSYPKILRNRKNRIARRLAPKNWEDQLWVAEIPSSIEMIAWRAFATKLEWSCLKFSGPF